MAFFVLIALVAALIVYISLAPRKKRALIISAVILGAYMLYVRLTCGPDPRDVKVMKPMAEAISDYIIKHGVPKSLQDIPNLPYRLEGCEREEEYSVFDKKLYKDVKVKQKNEATYKSIEEECLFSKSGRTYYLQSRSLFDLVNNTGGIPRSHAERGSVYLCRSIKWCMDSHVQRGSQRGSMPLSGELMVPM